MKPTKEIIELSKKLHELGYRQDIKVGDWMFTDKNISIISDTASIRLLEHPLMTDHDFVIIPSLEDGLLWLTKKKGFTQACYVATEDSQRWSCFVGNEDLKNDFIETISHTSPHEAVLKAMVKVLEAKEEE